MDKYIYIYIHKYIYVYKYTMYMYSHTYVPSVHSVLISQKPNLEASTNSSELVSVTLRRPKGLQHTATHCNTLQHTQATERSSFPGLVIINNIISICPQS